MTRGALVAALALAAATACSGSPAEPLSSRVVGGPLDEPKAHGYEVTMPVGETFTDAFETLRMRGAKPATIDSVELVGSEGLQIVGFSLVGPQRKVSIQYMSGYPPSDPDLDQNLVVPGRGAEVDDSRAGWELLLGIRVTEDGYHVRDGIRVNYTVDGTEYTEVFPAQLVVCTSPDMEVDGQCPFPQDLE